MAGEVAPRGVQRYMRLHNVDGTMEYWLESADLMDIRKEAEVKDPYWTPPPGWKLGDNRNQDPVCAKELKELREKIAKMKEYGPLYSVYYFNSFPIENKETDRKSCKRKLQGAAYKTQMREKLKNERKNQQITLYKPKKGVKNSIDRWSFQSCEKHVEDYEGEGISVWKSNTQASIKSRGQKADWGHFLLDHLSKHMAGEVASGGEQRFMRRHNADGGMEYWLESADLMDIRKEAEVKDPYWTPPSGWKLGDNPTEYPVCAKELKELREKIAKMSQCKGDNRENRRGPSSDGLAVEARTWLALSYLPADDMEEPLQVKIDPEDNEDHAEAQAEGRGEGEDEGEGECHDLDLSRTGAREKTQSI
ncbi:hypothetical protein PTKIN_Ptkin05aG0219600 [Pterospermum kingtungense]